MKDIIDFHNSQVDEYNTFDTLDGDEKVEAAIKYFENRICETCKFDGCGCSVQDDIWRLADLDDRDLPDLDNFGCNKWETQ